ncbi:hypothetical protein BC941DRAFT_468997 [Chlamydoabsidia padenii]|nr:hypothetical protein BC941DRAFT_468997 [Chlamydoabsidia padenii]
MTLILTTTCHYALLVAIEEGAGFPSLCDGDIFVQSRLSLHLPDTVGDLIPPSTIISAKPTKLVPNPQWRTTLVYFLSAKLLKRLRRQHAQVTLQIKTMAAEQGNMLELGTATLKVDQAKVIKMVRGQQPLNILKNYVVDKGEWKPIRKDGAESTVAITTTTKCTTQIKAGLFVVDMPPPVGERQREVATPLSRYPLKSNKRSSSSSSSSSSNNGRKLDDDLGLEIYSVDTSDCLTATNSSSRDTDDDRDNENMTDQWRTTASNSPIALDHFTITTTNKSNYNYKTKIPSNQSSPTLPSPSPSPAPSISPPSSVMGCLRVTQCNAGQLPYLQIGNGQQRYTFIFRIVEATAVTSLLLSSKDQQHLVGDNTTESLLQYTFSDWQVRHGVISKGNTWIVIDSPMRLFLQGHLHDLQHWLYQQGQIEVCLVLVDKAAKCDHTIGKAMVRLKGWCPLTMEQASFPIHDRSNRLHLDQPFQFAKVVVQLGLISGWRDEEGGGDLPKDDLMQSLSIDTDNPFIRQQQRRQHQQRQKESPFLHPNLIK